MYVKVKKQNFPILDLVPRAAVAENIVRLTPKVTSVNKTNNRNGQADLFLELELYARVNASNFKNNVNDPTTSTPTEIEVRLSKHSMNHYSSKANEKASDKIKNKARSKKIFKGKVNVSKPVNPMLTSAILSPNQLVTAVSVTSQHSINTKKSLYEGTILAGKIDLASITSPVIKREKLVINKVGTTYQSAIDEKTVHDSKSFSKVYNSMIEMNEDPARIFQQGFMKTSLKHRKGGILTSTNKKNDRHRKVLDPIFKNIESSIKTISKSQYKISTAAVEEALTKVKTKISINFSKLQDLGETFYVLLITKNHLGINLEAQSYEVFLSDIEDQLENKTTNYAMSPVRLNTGVSILNIGTSDEKKKVDLNLHAKKLKVSKPFEMCYYEDFGRIVVAPNQKVKIQDGVAGGSSRSPTNFKRSESVFYRTTLNYGQKRYFNAKSVSDKSRHKNEMTPHLTIIAKISSDEESFNLEVSNISENILAIRPRKYIFKGETSATSKLLPIFPSINPLERYTKTQGGTTLKFKDFDVYRTTNYKYVVECIMKNGEKKLASAFFIEKFEERTGAINFDNFSTSNYTPTGGASDFTGIRSLDDITRRVEGNFLVIQTMREIDEILKNMFGNLFELFKDKLKTIRDVQSVVKSIEITRIDHLTGRISPVTTVTPDEEGFCQFIDKEAPVYSNLTYKLTPRLVPTQDLIQAVQSATKFLAARNIFKTSRFNLAASKSRKEENRQNIISSVGSKYAKRESFLRGLIASPEYTAARENLDLFLDNSTGDVAYFEVPGLDITKREKDIKIDNASASLIEEFEDFTFKSRAKPLQQKGASKIRDVKSRKTCYYDLNFNISGNDAFVDFYAMFVKENNEVYLDGIMHSIDSYSTSMNYAYLIEHNGGFGIAEYYIVPFYKDGQIGAPKFVTANKLY